MGMVTVVWLGKFKGLNGEREFRKTFRGTNLEDVHRQISDYVSSKNAEGWILVSNEIESVVETQLV